MATIKQWTINGTTYDIVTHGSNFRSLRDFTLGTLITTSLNGGSTNCSIPFLLTIEGNGYGGGHIFAQVQGYVYHLGNGYSTYINCDGFALGAFPSSIIAFSNADGNLCFWWERIAYWQGYDVCCYDCSQGINTQNLINYVISITDSTKPSVRTWETVINIKKYLNSANYTEYTVTKTGSGASGTWPINISGNAATATSADTINSTLPISKGGTGGTTAAAARSNLATPNMITDSYPTLMTIDGGNNWIKIGTSNSSYGLLPSTSGGAGAGHNYIGTSSWYWKYAYIDLIYGTTNGTHNGRVNGATSTASSWLDGQRYERGGLNLTNATDTGSYWPWIRQTNTGSARWFSFGILNNSFYMIGSATSRTANSYDYGFWFNIATGEGNATKWTGAVWNDYAEYRKSDETEPGRVVMEDDNGVLQKATLRLQSFAGVVSDTFGFAEGETNEAKTPLAVAGRVLVYPYQDRNEYRPGDCVCAAPNGTVDIMTREEIITFPDRIVGTVSEIPQYETWGTGNVEVNGRIWIKVR